MDVDLPAFPLPPASGLAPAADFARRRAECPFGRVRLPSGDSAILLVRHADVAAAVSSPALSRNHLLAQAPRRSGEPNFLYDPDLLINQSAQAHATVHRIATRAMNHERVAAHRPVIHRIADALVDTMTDDGRPGGDLVAEYTDRLPLLTITRLLGIPAEDCDDIRRWSGAYTHSHPGTPQERARLVAEFGAYVREVVTAAPRAALLADLVHPPDSGVRLSTDELVSLTRLMLSAGVEAPATVLGRAMLRLLADDAADWRTFVRRGTDPLAMADELLRLVYAGNVAALRTATTDLVLPSGTVSRGGAVLLAWISALHDPAVHPRPEALLPGRRAPKFVGFGGGRHYCPGRRLGRAILAVGLDRLRARLPGLRLATDGPIPIAEREVGAVVTRLPVRW
ncbi:cytochrome P450 [Micromonospora matsumotoense]|uniref:cytochrome P450 n=1 Tax=Micromonospora matsumotoense TaxID=121616 RepID=UPI0033D575C9